MFLSTFNKLKGFSAINFIVTIRLASGIMKFSLRTGSTVIVMLPRDRKPYICLSVVAGSRSTKYTESDVLLTLCLTFITLHAVRPTSVRASLMYRHLDVHF